MTNASGSIALTIFFCFYLVNGKKLMTMIVHGINTKIKSTGSFESNESKLLYFAMYFFLSS